MLSPGTTLGGRYRLDERIAGGGMGDVWRGTDEVLGRTVAVKVLLPALLDEPGFAERFRGEARTMATINHPGVVDVYDYGSESGTAFLVMEYVEGDALSRTLSRVGRLTPARAMALVAQAADALHAAHDKGIVHRDVKPGNLMVRPNGTLVLTDFGIARSAMVGQLTAAGSVLGTASYISPEQASGQTATALSDVYALGVVAYQCLSGRRPFEGDNPLEIAMRHVRDTPAPLPGDIPPTVRQIVERAMAKDPAARWPTAAALAQVARRTSAQLASAGSHTGTPVSGARPASGPPVSGARPVTGAPVSGVRPVTGAPVSGVRPASGPPSSPVGLPGAPISAPGSPIIARPPFTSAGAAAGLAVPPGGSPVGGPFPPAGSIGPVVPGGTRVMPGGLPPRTGGPVSGAPVGMPISPAGMPISPAGMPVSPAAGHAARGSAGVPPPPPSTDTSYTYLGAGGYPVQPGTSTPRDGRRTGLIVTAAVLGVLVLLMCVGGGIWYAARANNDPGGGGGSSSASPGGRTTAAAVGTVNIPCDEPKGRQLAIVRARLIELGLKVDTQAVDGEAGKVVEVTPCGDVRKGSQVTIKVGRAGPGNNGSSGGGSGGPTAGGSTGPSGGASPSCPPGQVPAPGGINFCLPSKQP